MSAIDDRTSDVFREVYERLDAESPEAPEWSAIPMSGFRPFPVWRGAFVAAAVAAAVLLVIGVTGLIAPWQRSVTSPVGSADVEGVIVAVYLADDIDADQLAIVTETLTTAPGVIDWRYISKTEAYEEKMVEWADREDYIEILRDNPDILPASIRLLTGNQTDAKAVDTLILKTFPTPASGVMGLAIARGTLSEVDLPFGYDGNSPFMALHTINEGWVAVVLLDDGIAADQRDQAIETLGAQRGVIEVLYIDKATALEEARILFASDPEMIRVLDENPYLLPASIRVLTQARRQADAIASTADTLPGVIKTEVYRGPLIRTDPLPPANIESPSPTTSADTTTSIAATARPLFSGESPWVLLFDDGLEGVIVVDPNDPVERHMPIEGQAAGDQPNRLTLVGNRLVVGWGEIYAYGLDDGVSTPIGDATIYVPTTHDGVVWLVRWSGGRIGAGDATAWLVYWDGVALTDPTPLPPSGYPIIGVPVGVVLRTDAGLVVWSPDGTSRELGFGWGAQVLDGYDSTVAICPGVPCSAPLLVDTDTDTDEATTIEIGRPIETGRFGARAARFSPDGSRIAFTTSDGIVIADVETLQTVAVSMDIGVPDRPLYVEWAPDGRTVFVSNWSYGYSDMTIARYDLATGELEISTLPYGGGIGFVVVDRNIMEP